MKVTSELLGGLGNQMFQYAAARALADRTGARLLLDTSQFESYALRRYELGDLRVRGTQVTPKPASRSMLVRRARAAMNRLKPARFTAKIYREKSFSFDAHLLAQKPPVRLSGYWQSEKYFADHAQAIRRDFEVLDSPSTANAEMAGRIRGARNAVSLHVRRGDYVTNAATNAYHGTCSPAYYAQAVDHIASKCGTLTLFVFSDDLTWVRRNMQFAHPTVYVDSNVGGKGAWDMHLMKQCQHHVVANSSFSWWGAWLNPSSEKIVVAPKRWFADESIDTSDLVPAAWVRL